MTTHLPLPARLFARLITGPDADVLRGDLEEQWHRQRASRGDSLALRLAMTRDALASLCSWWRHRALHRAHARLDSAQPHRPMRTIGPDLRHMLRGLRRRPGYAAMVAMTLGLGIGATTTIYSVVDALLIRPLPYRDAQSLVLIGNTLPDDEWLPGRTDLQKLEWLSLPNFADLRERSRGIASSAAIERRNWLYASPESGAELLDVANVEAGFFDLLGVQPSLGRLPRDGDQAVDQGMWGTVISHDAWQRRFGGDPNVIGRRFHQFSIIGVLPSGFVQPAALVGSNVDFFVHLDPAHPRYADRRRRSVQVIARLAPGVDVARLRQELAAAQAALATAQPDGNVLPDGRSLGAGVNSLRDATVGEGRRPLSLFLGAALLLLALAGTNAANLLIVRGLERDGELSLRRALGAGRRRLAANLVAESVALAIAGGVLGLGLATAGVGLIRRFGPEYVARVGDVGVNLRIVAAGAVLSVFVGVLVGLLPAVRASGADLLSNLRASLTAMSARGTRVRTSLAATQLALALVLGVGAALLFRSFVTLRSEPLGFESRDRVSFAVAFKNDRPWETWDRIIARVEALPGVSAASGTSTLPLTSPTTLRFVPAELPADAPTSDVAFYSIAPNYFEVAGTRMVAGRAFASTDVPTSARVAIINEAYALAHYRNRNPVGRQLRGLDADRPLEIVGVVRNVVQARVEDGARPAVYLPHTQAPAVLNVVAVTRRDPEGLMPDLRRALAEEGMWNAPVLGLMTLEARVGRALASPRFQMLLIAAFAGVAVLLAAIGLYGTLSYSVRSRTRELGIRMAMGASEQQILGLVWRQGMRVMLFGLVAGLAGAFVLTRVMRGVLFRISTSDPVAFAAALAAIVVAVVVASLWPARRAARLDPMSTIRSQT